MTTKEPKKLYKGICTQEVLSIQTQVPRSTIYDYCKREGISLKEGVTHDVAEKVFHHFVVTPNKKDFINTLEFLGTYA